MDLLCPSEGEMREAFRLFDESVPAVVSRLLDETRTRAALVTMGTDGLIGFEQRGGRAQPHTGGALASRLKSEHVPALCGHAVDALPTRHLSFHRTWAPQLQHEDPLRRQD